jgi:hypothetical protein
MKMYIHISSSLELSILLSDSSKAFFYDYENHFLQHVNYPQVRTSVETEQIRNLINNIFN